MKGFIKIPDKNNEIYYKYYRGYDIFVYNTSRDAGLHILKDNKFVTKKKYKTLDIRDVLKELETL